MLCTLVLHKQVYVYASQHKVSVLLLTLLIMLRCVLAS
jgi:hypothetical protein